MIDDFVSGWFPIVGVFRRLPQLDEPRTGGSQFANQPLQRPIVRVAANGEAEVGDQSFFECSPFLCRLDRPVSWTDEISPNTISLESPPAGGIPHQRVIGRVGEDQIPCCVMDADRSVLKSVDQTLHTRGDPGGDHPPSRGHQAREIEQLLSLGIREAKGPAQPLDHRFGGGRGASLLQTGEVINRDARQGGQFLSPESGSPSSAARRNADSLRGDPVAPTSQRPTEVARFHLDNLQGSSVLILALAVLRQRDGFLSRLPSDTMAP
jgi:hypothetical protein